MAVDQAQLKVAELTVLKFEVEHRLQVGRRIRGCVGVKVPSFLR